jgi:hypothetical protein
MKIEISLIKDDNNSHSIEINENVIKSFGNNLNVQLNEKDISIIMELLVDNIREYVYQETAYTINDYDLNRHIWDDRKEQTK